MIHVLHSTKAQPTPRHADPDYRQPPEQRVVWKIQAIAQLYPGQRPLCFDTDAAWSDYLNQASASTRAEHRDGPILWATVAGRREVWRNPDFSICDDCTARREAAMRAVGRCVKVAE